MKSGDLVKEVSKMDRACSMGIVLKTQANYSAAPSSQDIKYLVHFFDDDDKCWMSSGFLEAISEIE